VLQVEVGFQQALFAWGVGFIGEWFAAGIWIVKKQPCESANRGIRFAAQTAKLKMDDKTAID
jgi:hypothetical protein